MNLTERLRVKPGRTIVLSDYDSDATPGCRRKEDVDEIFEETTTRLAELQYLLYAESKRSLLIVLQAMDTGGKDGTIRHVMTRLNPAGCDVNAFKAPTAPELAHDYLWRIHRAVPPKGEIGIFNRSHYEDVIVVRVHKLTPRSVWEKRFEQINQFERFLVENDVTIIKIFLNISKGEQKRRLEDRIKDPKKHWKLSPADLAERKHWSQYQRAYEEALGRCSTKWAPWFIIPADKKWYRNHAVSQIMLETLESMKLKFPKPTFDPTKIKLS
ncbi:MAG: polyphosphate kinase 2 family protein [Candidatus Eisenbacteria bacterium]|nr:polyphosphate kinase 2 family protein [Candidatus Eisenbacteria bacterium]